MSLTAFDVFKMPVFLEPIEHADVNYEGETGDTIIHLNYSTNSSIDMPSSDLDKAFELIEEGNELETKEEHWQASAKYSDACTLLNKLADEAPSTTDEEQKIIQLYQKKSRHYRQVGRKSLMKALQTEHERDAESNGSTLVVSSLSAQQAERRIRTFSILFSKTAESVGEKTSMLEERLMELNASLPSGFKTENERLADINRGLGRLGLSLYPNSNHGSSSHVQPPQSEEDQVAQIIAQAQDQARYETPATETNDAASVSKDDSSSSGISSQESSDDSISADDLLDEPTFKNRKAIRHEVIKAQVKLAELLAMISTEPDINLSENEKDDANDNDSEDPKAGFNVDYGKATLVAARDCLNKALKEWPDDS